MSLLLAHCGYIVINQLSLVEDNGQLEEHSESQVTFFLTCLDPCSDPGPMAFV